MYENIIEISELNKTYPFGKESIRVLFDIHFTVKSGEFVVIMGPSGSGKTTLLNIIGCLDQPTTGSYRLREKEVSQLSEIELSQVRNQDIGFIFQSFNLLSRLNIFQNVELPLIYGNVPKAERVKRVQRYLQKLDLVHRHHHRPNEISGGQKQRVAIARALVTNPALLLADEPTGNLDSTTSGDIMKIFQTLHQEGHTIVMITHEQDIAAYAQKIYSLRDGRLHPPA